MKMIADIAKILFGLGLIFIIVKGLGKKPTTYGKLYILHKAGAGIATILSFIHGFTIVPQSQTYLITGWCVGLLLLSLFVVGVFLGFQNNWVPFDDDKNRRFKKLRIFKWLFTALIVIALGSHYLLSSP
ncbi:MAG: hypothetical protein ACFFBJ_07645 [Promethearchaeota archaeon]